VFTCGAADVLVVFEHLSKCHQQLHQLPPRAFEHLSKCHPSTPLLSCNGGNWVGNSFFFFLLFQKTRSSSGVGVVAETFLETHIELPNCHRCRPAPLSGRGAARSVVAFGQVF